MVVRWSSCSFLAALAALSSRSMVPPVRAQNAGGFTQPFGGNQPWTSEPVPIYAGLGQGYTVTRFSSVRLTGLPLDDPASVALGVYLPVDLDGDNAVDLHSGRPLYLQRDARAVAPAQADVATGVRPGRFYLYYHPELGGWAVHQVAGSSQALLFTSADAAMAHELHGLRRWEAARGDALLPDRRLQLLNLAHDDAAAAAGRGPFAPPGARLNLAAAGQRQAVEAAGRLAPQGDLCPQGAFRDEFTGNCAACPRGRFGDSNALTSSAGCEECPPGKFLGAPGGRTALDCANCTAGRYASSPGAEACGGACPLGRHSAFSGAVDASTCLPCPRGYRSAQCDRKDNSKQARRLREREKREKIKRSRQDSARSQAGTSCAI